MIYCVGPRDKKSIYKDKLCFNVTSRSTDFCKALSPFYLGPVDLYDGWISNTMEAAWQHSKVYEKYTTDGEINDGYWIWAYSGWNSKRPERYPMGKGAKPLYSYWNGTKYGYVDARKNIYIPLYKECALKTEAYYKLKKMYEDGVDFYLWDFDVDYNNKSYEELVNDSTKTFGHGYVLKYMMEGKI